MFDLDGTLVDSESSHEASYKAVLKQYSPETLSCFDYEILKGRPTRESFRLLGLSESLTPLKQQEYRRRVLSGEVDTLPGAHALVEGLSQQGKRLFLVTGASSEAANAILRHHRLDIYFEGIVSAEDVTRGKPDPEPYLQCLSRYGLEAEKCLAVEDAENGVQSALAAGLKVAYVNPGAKKELGNWCFPNLRAFHKELQSDV